MWLLIFEIWSILIYFTLYTSKFTILKINHNSKTKSRTKKMQELKYPFQSIAHLSCKFGQFWTNFFLDGDTRIWFRNANQWYPRTSWLEGFDPKAFGVSGRSPSWGEWGAKPSDRHFFLNFSTRWPISRKLKIGKSIFHLLQEIEHLSCEFCYLWKILYGSVPHLDMQVCHQKL